ncbi:MAG: efflux RND transporter permease subunit [Porticoccaceae bacterium]
MWWDKVYTRLITTYPKYCLALVAILTLASSFVVKDIRIDNNFAALFATDSEEMAFRRLFRETFSADDNQLIAILERKDIRDTALIKLVESISNRIEEIPGIERVLSATHSSVLWTENDDIYVDPLFGSNVNTDKSFAARLAQLTSSTFGGGYLASEDGRYFLIIGEMPANLDDLEKIQMPAEQFRRQIESLVKDANEDISVYFAGLPLTRIAAIESMQKDLVRSTQLTTLALVALLFVIFRHWLLVALPLLSIGAGVVVTAAIIRLNGDDLNQMTIIYPVLLMVVTIANATHLLHRFLREYQYSQCLEQAVAVSGAKIARVSFLTAITTAIGFASMLIANMQILYSFGLYLALGVLVSFIILCVFIPAGLMVFFKPSRDPSLALQALGNQRLLPSVFFKICIARKNAALLLGIGLCLLSWSLWQSQDAQYDYSINKMLNEHSDIATGNRLMDSKLSGTLPIEVSFLSPQKDAFKQPQNLLKIAQFSDWLQQTYPFRTPVSLASAVLELNEAFSGERSLPDSSAAIAQLLLVAESAPDAPIAQIANHNFSHTRLRTSTADHGSQYVMALKQAIDHKGAEIFSNSQITVQMTGEAPAGYRGINLLAQELIQSVLLALVVIIVTIGIAFRSPTMALASVFPNVLPIMIGLALYSLTGEKLNPLPGVAFCIAIGIAVDDTVHLLARYTEQLHSNKNPHQAMLAALEQVTPALFHSSIILVSGFLIFTLSEFEWNQQLGILGAGLVLLAFISDIIFTPAVISLLTKPIRKAN